MPSDQQTYRFGEFTLDAGEHQLLQGEHEVRLRPKALDTLLYSWAAFWSRRQGDCWMVCGAEPA
jgi:hypothetical protein